MPDLTQPDPVDVGMAVLLDQPSYAAQVLVTFARLLELDAREEMTGLVRERGIDIAADTILRELPNVVCRESLTRAYAVMPALTLHATRGQYALLVRTAARELGMTSEQQPTEAERVAALHREAAADRAAYQTTRQQGAATGNLTRLQQYGGDRR